MWSAASSYEVRKAGAVGVPNTRGRLPSGPSLCEEHGRYYTADEAPVNENANTEVGTRREEEVRPLEARTRLVGGIQTRLYNEKVPESRLVLGKVLK